MKWDFKLKDVILNIHTNQVGRVTEISKKWGWFKVRYSDGSVREYGITNDRNQNLVRLTKEMYADYRLSLENNGITDSWRE